MNVVHCVSSRHSHKTHGQDASVLPTAAKCSREPFGVLGKLTQNEHFQKSHLPNIHKTHGQDTRTLTVHTGAFRGPGKTHTKRTPPYSANDKIPTKHMVRIISDPKTASSRSPVARNLARGVEKCFRGAEIVFDAQKAGKFPGTI